MSLLYSADLELHTYIGDSHVKLKQSLPNGLGWKVLCSVQNFLHEWYMLERR
jgi:hypothetical protein